MTEITDLSTTDATNTSITGESLEGNVANMARMDNTLQAVMGLLARSIRTNVLRFLDNADPTKKLALNLSRLTTATERTLTFPDANVDLGNTLLATRRNRIVNGDMRVSQENGTTSGTTNGRYPVDQWAQYFVTSAGTLTVAQVASVTPAGSPNRLRATVTVADASLAAGEYWTLSQNLEGSNVADFQYGGSSAKASVLRFGFKGPAGTYAAALHNSAANRSFVALFTISAGQANTDTVQTIAITGDTTGTWLTTDGVIGITLDIVLAAGSTYQGVAGWQAGNVLGTSAVSNGMGTGSAVFELFDVGLKLDPDATGVYGAYEVGEVDAVYYPDRYFQSYIYPPLNGLIGGDTRAYVSMPIETMCKTPTPSFAGTLTIQDGENTGTLNAIFVNSSTTRQARMALTLNSALTLYRPAVVFLTGSPILSLNARLS